MIGQDRGGHEVVDGAVEEALDLGGVSPLAFVHKTRDITVPNQAVSKEVVGQVAGRTCVLIDDMIDTAGTIAGAVKVRRARARCPGRPR
jgi:ribose-phosphate pyrophosphokinase